MSFVSGIQGQVLEVTVIGCTKLKDTEWLSRQDPYVCIEYGNNKSRTRTCTDGGKNPAFQEKFVFTLIEGLRELNVVVWNSNTLTFDDFIGNGRIQLQKVLAEGYDDSNWPLQTKTGRYAGEVRLIMHYANGRKHDTSYASSAPYPSHVPHYSMYSAPPPANTSSSYYSYAPSPYANAPPTASYPTSYHYSSPHPPNGSPAYPLLPTPYSPSPYQPSSPSPYPPGSHGHYYPPPSPY